MNELIINYLKSLKTKRVSLTNLENLVSGQITYADFASEMIVLEDNGFLSRIKAAGENGKMPALANTYQIHRNLLRQQVSAAIQKAQLNVHNLIHLESYYSVSEEQWEKDWPFIQKVDCYLKMHQLPSDEVPAPERSYELVGDEKWITELGGKELLERTKVWSLLGIIPVADPMMFAVNPVMLGKNSHHLHLVVENKTTYQALQKVIIETPFTTIIYGAGKRIIASIAHFHDQLPLTNASHEFYYFGDLDYEGINIWFALNEKQHMKLAVPFYQALFKKPFFKGKLNHRQQQDAYLSFLSNFNLEEQKLIEDMFKIGGYYPQEAISTAELQEIWRENKWNLD